MNHVIGKQVTDDCGTNEFRHASCPENHWISRARSWLTVRARRNGYRLLYLMVFCLGLHLFGQVSTFVTANPVSPGNAYAAAPADVDTTRVAKIRSEFLDPQSRAVLVIAHRGDWRNAPENSVQAIKNCGEMGVDIVEIDISKTKDGRLILMHDKTLDRTTTGTGKVSDITFDELRALRLRNGQGQPTRHLVPTLEEALEAARGKVMINLDKAFDHFREIHEIITAADMRDHILLKGHDPADKVAEKYGDIIGNVLYMPIIFVDRPNAEPIFDSFMQGKPPIAIEFVFGKDTSLLRDQLRRAKERGVRPWVNTLWPRYCAAHDDDAAVDDIDESYGWILDQGFTMIQTDRPEMLLDYLRARDRRPHETGVPAMAGAAP